MFFEVQGLMKNVVEWNRSRMKTVTKSSSLSSLGPKTFVCSLHLSGLTDKWRLQALSKETKTLPEGSCDRLKLKQNFKPQTGRAGVSVFTETQRKMKHRLWCWKPTVKGKYMSVRLHEEGTKTAGGEAHVLTSACFQQTQWSDWFAPLFSLVTSAQVLI